MNARVLLMGLALLIVAQAVGAAAESPRQSAAPTAAPTQPAPTASEMAPLGVCPYGGAGLGMGYGRGAGWGGGRGYGRGYGYGWGRLYGGQGPGRGPGFVDLNGNGICDRWEQLQTNR